MTAAFSAAIALATTIWAIWLNQPHATIKAAADPPQVDAVIVKPKTADEVKIGNVVASATEAARLPGVAA